MSTTMYRPRKGGTAAAAMVIALYLNDTLTGNCYTFVNSNLLVNSQTDHLGYWMLSLILKRTMSLKLLSMPALME